jgi:hypothetical protein
VSISRAIYGMNPFPESLAIAGHIEANSQPGDRVLIVGSEPQILFYAARRSATRYMYFYPLTGEFPDARLRQQSVLDEVRAARPLYVVWVEVATSLLRSPRGEPLIFDAVADMLARDYEVELVARPTSDLSGYAFDRGETARHFERNARARPDRGLPWLAVYRRVHGAEGVERGTDPMRDTQ